MRLSIQHPLRIRKTCPYFYPLINSIYLRTKMFVCYFRPDDRGIHDRFPRRSSGVCKSRCKIQLMTLRYHRSVKLRFTDMPGFRSSLPVAGHVNDASKRAVVRCILSLSIDDPWLAFRPSSIDLTCHTMYHSHATVASDLHLGLTGGRCES